MALVQPDFAGKVRCFEGEDAYREFQRIFGFSAKYVVSAAMRALRPVIETDHIHAQASAEGSGFYHTFVSEVKAEIDTLDRWTANRDIDNRMSPRAYRNDGLVLAFAPGNGATGRSSRELGLRHLGPVTALELQRHNAQTDQMTLDFNQLSAEASSRPHTFWLIVYKRVDDRVSLEVSLPIADQNECRIVGWDKRLIFGEISWNAAIAEAENNDERNESGDVAVAISAR